jgi:SAM-dependent methyltransferase
VFDQCCGAGHLSIALAQNGATSIGVDLCGDYIRRGKQRCIELDLQDRCRLEIADAYQYVASQPCDLAINWYSSFGYAMSDAQNAQMLDRAYESLTPGGHLLLDTPSFPGILRRFQKHMVQRGQVRQREVLLIRTSEFDLVSGRFNQCWEWWKGDSGPIVRHSSLRLYWPHEIREMLEGAGFTAVTMYGHIDSSPLTVDSPRAIFAAMRPATLKGAAP